MQIGEQGKTGSQFLDMFSLLQAAQSHGRQRNKRRQLCQPQKRNISPWYKQQRSLFGFKDSSTNSASPSPTPTSFMETIKGPSLLQTTPSITPEPSISIFSTTLFENAFKTTKSTSNIARRLTWWQME